MNNWLGDGALIAGNSKDIDTKQSMYIHNEKQESEDTLVNSREGGTDLSNGSVSHPTKNAV